MYSKIFSYIVTVSSEPDFWVREGGLKKGETNCRGFGGGGGGGQQKGKEVGGGGGGGGGGEPPKRARNFEILK